MIESFVRYLFPVIAAEFRSDYPLADSILRLQDARPSADSRSLLPQRIEVSFDGTNVEVSLLRLLSGNPFKPRFMGAFRQTPQGVVLGGEFGTSRWIKIWHLSMLAFVAFLEAITVVLAPIALMDGQARAWLAPLPFLGFLLLILGTIKLNQWFARYDVALLSSAIREALTTQIAESSCTPRPSAKSSKSDQPYR